MLREGLSIGDLEYAGHVCKTFPRWQRDQLFRASPCDAPEDGILYCPNACDGVTVSLPPTPQFFGEPGRTIGAGRNSRTLSRRTGGSILRRESQSVAAREDLFCLNWRWAGSTRRGRDRSKDVFIEPGSLESVLAEQDQMRQAAVDPESRYSKMATRIRASIAAKNGLPPGQSNQSDD